MWTRARTHILQHVCTLSLLVFLSKKGSTVELHSPDAGYPDRLCCSGKFVHSYTKFTCLEITGYPIKYSTVLWLLELEISRGRKV